MRKFKNTSVFKRAIPHIDPDSNPAPELVNDVMIFKKAQGKAAGFISMNLKTSGKLSRQKVEQENQETHDIVIWSKEVPKNACLSSNANPSPRSAVVAKLQDNKPQHAKTQEIRTGNENIIIQAKQFVYSRVSPSAVVTNKYLLAYPQHAETAVHYNEGNKKTNKIEVRIHSDKPSVNPDVKPNIKQSNKPNLKPGVKQTGNVLVTVTEGKQDIKQDTEHDTEQDTGSKNANLENMVQVSPTTGNIYIIPNTSPRSSITGNHLHTPNNGVDGDDDLSFTCTIEEIHNEDDFCNDVGNVDNVAAGNVDNNVASCASIRTEPGFTFDEKAISELSPSLKRQLAVAENSVVNASVLEHNLPQTPIDQVTTTNEDVAKENITRDADISNISNAITTIPAVCGSYGYNNVYILDASAKLFKGECDQLTGKITIGSPSMMGSISASYVWRVCSGLAHFIALDTNGKVHAWGENSYGQVGSSVNKQSEPLPVDVIPAGIVHVSAGHHFSVALDEAGTVWTWGHNDHGQLGHSSYDDCSRPCPIQRGSISGRHIECITAGECHALALDTLGQVHAWGDNRFGQLGNHRSSLKSAMPVHVSSFGSLYTKFAAVVSAGANISMAVDISGYVHAWGRLNASQIPGSQPLDVGYGGISSCNDYMHGKYWTPSIISNSIPVSEIVVSVIAGSTYMVVLTMDDNLYAASVLDTPSKGNVIFKKLNGVKATIITSLGVYAWGYLPRDCADASCWQTVI